MLVDLDELRLDLDPSLAPLPNLEPQDLTGLVGAVSDRRLLPPQEPVRDAAPLGFLGEQRREGLRVAAIERFGCRAQLIDHVPSMALGATVGV